METHAPTPVKTYLLTFAALVVLLGATVGVAYIDLGPLNPLLALLIASIKALLVVLFFMHVRGSSPLTKLFVVMGLLWLVILFGLTLADYLTRLWQTTVVW
jgi:cytochrome c oxidase subunit IV